MNQTTQHFSPDPALDFANAILEETNGAIELIEILRDIAEGNDEDATTNDRIAANLVLTDRALGKAPKLVSPNVKPNFETAPKIDDNYPAPKIDDTDVEPAPYSIRGALREAPPAVPHKEPDSPRLVTQIDESLNQSLGPAPSAHNEPALSLPKGHYHEKPALVPRHGGGNPESCDISHSPGEPDPYPIQDGGPGPLDPYSVHFAIQDYILTITNNGQTLRDALLEIARAKEDPAVRPYHRRRAATLLLERALGTDPNAVRNAVCTDCRQRWTTHPGSHTHPVQSPAPAQVEDRLSDDEIWAKILADLKELEDQGILTPQPNARPIDISIYRMPKDFDSTPYEEEEAAKFKAEIELRLERQKQWPEIEERRRKKLEQIYPSHSDGDPPDT